MADTDKMYTSVAAEKKKMQLLKGELDAIDAGKADKATVAAGSYNKVTVNSQGIVTAGENPTTLAGHGIQDAYTKSETYSKTEINNHFDTPNQGYASAVADSNTTTANLKTLIDTAAGSDKEKADFIYRVGCWDGSQYDDTVYSEYAWNGTEYLFLSKKPQIDEVFDITAYNANTTYPDLATALGTNGANVPAGIRKGGMSIKFVQSSDNKYVQYRLMSDSFDTTVSNWQGVDDEPTASSHNLVESGGVFGELGGLLSYNSSILTNSGYIKWSDGTITGSGYKSSGFIKVSEGEVVNLQTSASSATCAIAAYSNNTEESYLQDKSLQKTDGVVEYSYIVPIGVSYIRVNCSSSHLSNFALSIFVHGIKLDVERLKEDVSEIEAEVGDIKKEIGYVAKDTKTSSLLSLTGYIGWTDGVRVGTSSTYKCSDFIKVNEGDIIYLVTSGSASVCAIAAYGSNTEESYSQQKSVDANGINYSEYNYIVPSGVGYVRITCNKNELPSFYYSIVQKSGIKGDIDSLNEEVFGDKTFDNSSILSNTGYILWSDGTMTGSGYHCSDFIKVSEGEVLKLKTKGSATVCVLAAYSNNTENSYIQGKSIRGKNAGTEVTDYTYNVPSGVLYVRLVCSNSGLSLFSVEKGIEGLNEKVDALEEKVSEIYEGGGSVNEKIQKINNDSFGFPSYLLMKSRCSINFSFDDGSVRDPQIKAVFDEFNAKCGFAIITGEQRYLDFAKEGFEILAHGTDPLENADEATIRAAMFAGKKVVTDLGLVCHGWVTPNSALPVSLTYLTNDYFEYGYTVYKGTDTTGQTMTSDMKSYNLWRIHINTFLTCYQDVIADAISNNGMISVYGHGNELSQSGWNLDDLRTILQYCRSNGVEILTPFRSCLKLFENRHN